MSVFDAFISFIIGVIGSAVAGAYLQPLLLSTPAAWIIKRVCLSAPSLRGSLSGIWLQSWKTQNSHFWPDENNSQMFVYHFRDWIAAEWENKTKDGTVCSYFLLGRLYKGNYIIGKWLSNDSNGYVGGFMQWVDQVGRQCDGMYIGNRSAGHIESFLWKWSFVDRVYK